MPSSFIGGDLNSIESSRSSKLESIVDDDDDSSTVVNEGYKLYSELPLAVIKQFAGTGYESSDVMVIDEVEMQRHQNLDKFYRSTRAGKEFQKEIVKAAESFTAIGYKHIEAGTKLSEDCSQYGAENVSDKILAKGASIYGDARKHVEKEQEDLNKLLSSQILDPLRAMILGSPLEEARHLAQRYSRMRQEAETQAVEVSRRQARVKEILNPENVGKLHAAETKMKEIKANMAVLGIEASAALAVVEAQQQRLTFQRLVALITDVCSTCFEQRTVFTQHVLAKALNQMVDQNPIPLLFMRTVQAIDAFPSLVDFVMEILSKLVRRQVWRMPKLWVGFLKCASQTQPHSFPVLLQLPAVQLKSALNRYANVKGPLATYACQSSIKASLSRPILAVLGLTNETHLHQSH